MAVGASEGRTVVLVEGPSDRRAVEGLWLVAGRDLRAEGVEIVVLGGATNVGPWLRRLADDDGDVRISGLYDVGEERFFARALVATGRVPVGTTDLEPAGFFRCVVDLEDELIRALGTDRVLAIIEDRGDLASFVTLTRQPAHRERSTGQQLRRFLGTTSGRKIEYAGLLATALEPDALPRPLRLLLAQV